MRGAPSAVGPLIVGCASLLLAILVTWQQLENADALADATFRSQSLPLILWPLAIATLWLGIYRIGPRRRYLAGTTPEQRASDTIADRAAARQRRMGGVPPKGTPPDYGTRIDPEAPEQSPDR